MRRKAMKRFLIVAAITAAAVALPASATAMHRSTAAAASNQALLDWNVNAVNTMLAAKTFQTEGLIYVSYAQAAVYNAVTAIEGGFRPYRVRQSAPAGA